MNYEEYCNRRNTLHTHTRLQINQKLKSSTKWQKYLSKKQIK